jgi:hypothetical protein
MHAYTVLVVLLAVPPLITATGHTPLCREPRYMFAQTCVALCHENLGTVTVALHTDWPNGITVNTTVDGVAGPLMTPGFVDSYALALTVSTDTYTFCVISHNASPPSDGSITLTVPLTATTTHTVTMLLRLTQFLPVSATVAVGPTEILDSMEMALLFRTPILVRISLVGQIPCPLVCSAKSVVVIDSSINIVPPTADIRHCTCNSIRIKEGPTTPTSVTLCNIHIQKLFLEQGDVAQIDNINMEALHSVGTTVLFTRNEFDVPTAGGVQLQTGHSRYPSSLIVESSIVTVDTAEQRVTVAVAASNPIAPVFAAMDTFFRNGVVVDATVSASAALLFVACHFPLPGLDLNVRADTAAVGLTRNAFELMAVNIATLAATSIGLEATLGKVHAPLGSSTAKDYARLISIGNAWTVTSIVRYNGVDCVGECRVGLSTPLVPDHLVSHAPLPATVPTSVGAGVRVAIPLGEAAGVIPAMQSMRRRANANTQWVDVVKPGCTFTLDCVAIETKPDPLAAANVVWYVGPPWFLAASSQTIADTTLLDPRQCNGGELAGTLCETQIFCAENPSLQTPVVCTSYDGAAISLTTAVPLNCSSPVTGSTVPLACEYVTPGATISTVVPVSPLSNWQYEITISKSLSNPYREFGDVGTTCRSLDGSKRCQLATADLYPGSIFTPIAVAFGERRFAITDPGSVTETFAFQFAVTCLNGTLYDPDLVACIVIPPIVVVYGIRPAVITAATVALGGSAGILAVVALLEVFSVIADAASPTAQPAERQSLLAKATRPSQFMTLRLLRSARRLAVWGQP